MKIFRLSQGENNGWDTYDSCVVCALDEKDAITIHPNGDEFKEKDTWGGWAFHINRIQCEEIGEANEYQERGVICSSFNAG